MNVLAGVHEQYQGKNATTPSDTRQRYPLAETTREFVSNVIKPQNLIPKFEALCGPVIEADMVAVFSVKLSVAEVLNSGWRPHIEQWASYVRDHGISDRVILVIWHEPENDVPKYFKDAEQFVTYFNKIHDWVKSRNSVIRTCHAALGYRYGDKIDITDERARVWVNTKADIKAGDFYSGRSFPLSATLPELTSFKRWYAAVKATGGTAWGITERGWTASKANEYQVRADTIRREADWVTSLPEAERPAIVILWLTEGTEDDPGLRPDALMSEAVNYYLEKVTSEPESPQPTPEVKTTDCPLCMGHGVVPSETTYVIVRG